MPVLQPPDRLPAALAAALAPAAVAALGQVSVAANQAGSPLYLVGGVVRDLLLGRPPGRDVDLVVVGDAPALARTLAGPLHAQLTSHAAFGTATLTLPDRAAPVVIDMVTARREHYPTPGALPVVTPADLASDLWRRDFTINTLALRLGTPGEGPLVDVCGALDDLRAGVLRVLHARSFLDDPTRLLRGVRLAARLGMRFEPGTAALAHAAVEAGLLSVPSAERIWAEIELLLDEPDPATALGVAAEFGIPGALHAALNHPAAWERLRGAPPDRLARLGVLLSEAGDLQCTDLAQRYRLPAPQARVAAQISAVLDTARTSGLAHMPPSALDAALHGMDDATLQAAAWVVPEAAALIGHYRAHLRGLRPLLDGHDLLRLGIPPGPAIGQILRALRAARLDGQVATRADEERMARQLIGSRGGRGDATQE